MKGIRTDLRRCEAGLHGHLRDDGGDEVGHLCTELVDIRLGDVLRDRERSRKGHRRPGLSLARGAVRVDARELAREVHTTNVTCTVALGHDLHPGLLAQGACRGI